MNNRKIYKLPQGMKVANRVTVVDNEPTRYDVELLDGLNENRQALNENRQALTNFQSLSNQQRQKLVGHLKSIYEILGVAPGQKLEDGENFLTSLQFLVTNMNDLIVRTGRLEQAQEQTFSLLNQLYGMLKTDTSPTPTEDDTEKLYFVKHRKEAASTPDMSDTVSGVSGVSDTPTVQDLLYSQDFRRDVQMYTKPQLMKKYKVSESTIVRVKRLLREQGFNI